MQYPKEYNLSKSEQRVLSVIHRESLISVTDLAKKLRKPRTTIYTPIQHLLSRGLILSTRVKKEKLLSLAQHRAEYVEQGDLSGYVSEKHQNIEKIITKITQQISKGTYTKLRNIEATATIVFLLKEMNTSFMRRFSDSITASGIIVESVIEEDYLAECRRIYGEDKYTDFVKSLVGRPYNVSLIKKGILEPHVQLLILEDVFIINWKTKTFYQYKEKEMVNFFTTYFYTLQKQAVKVDINKFFN